jgi:hypothetical protein
MAWTGLARLVVPVIDQSPSMACMIGMVRTECASLGEALRAKGVAVHFIVFDDHATDGEALEALVPRGHGTRIALAFGLLARLLRANGAPGQLDVVFVSDGEDTHVGECTADLAAMERAPCPCRLFSVGVGRGFPTSLVTDHLYPLFGRESDPATPPVIPMECADDARGVFAQLRTLLSTPREPPPPGLEDFGEDTLPPALLDGARRVYNACMHACLFRRDAPEADALAACAGVLSGIEALCLRAVRGARARPAVKRTLPSQLLALDEPSADDALHAVQALRLQVRDCAQRVERDVLLSALDNDAKRNIAGFAGRWAREAVPQRHQHQREDHEPHPGDRVRVEEVEGVDEGVAGLPQGRVEQVVHGRAPQPQLGPGAGPARALQRVLERGERHGARDGLKAEAAHGGRRYGCLAVRAFKYHSVDFERVKAGLMGALRAYSGDPLDAELEDEINGFTQVYISARPARGGSGCRSACSSGWTTSRGRATASTS